MSKLYPAAIAVYAICAVAMFGTVWHRAECISTDTDPIMCTETRAAGSLLSAILWPLSLSVILQESDDDRS